MNVQLQSGWEKEARKNSYIPSLKLTYRLKIDPWKRRFLLETIIFRGYISFRECISFSKWNRSLFCTHFNIGDPTRYITRYALPQHFQKNTYYSTSLKPKLIYITRGDKLVQSNRQSGNRQLKSMGLRWMCPKIVGDIPPLFSVKKIVGFPLISFMFTIHVGIPIFFGNTHIFTSFTFKITPKSTKKGIPYQSPWIRHTFRSHGSDGQLGYFPHWEFP